MLQEFMYLEQLFGRSNSVWLSATLLIGLMLVLIFRPSAVHGPILFRVACWLLVFTVVVPPSLYLLLALCSPGLNTGRGMGMGSSNGETAIIMACVNFSGPILQGASIFCGLAALTPPMTRRTTPTGPATHPLEQS
jgi:hypothetical protein